ncbi:MULTISPECIES: DedA family protein [unclassified Nocardioides]|uniref:DedA family protein n=1 Tax=unclassified Nocardioides TaxID=2615069 RepID=UPI000A6DF9C8|nr:MULTISPECIES: VTT domain-containing protein [unclassified Nocardioides]
MNSLVATPFVVPMLLGIKWLDPEWLQHEYGAAFIWIAIGIVFVECGLFFPFLPGDTLLFALGLFIAGSNTTGYSVVGIEHEATELVIAMVLLTVAAFAGNVAGYEIGRKLGPPLYHRDGKILKKKYFDNTSAFFEKHGNKALVIGRFVPFVRTYITVVAGVTQMERRRFFVWSAIGAVLWVVSITLLGYFLGAAIPALGENIDYVTFAILAFSAVPLAWEWWRHKRPGAKGKKVLAPATEAPVAEER